MTRYIGKQRRFLRMFFPAARNPQCEALAFSGQGCDRLFQRRLVRRVEMRHKVTKILGPAGRRMVSVDAADLPTLHTVAGPCNGADDRCQQNRVIPSFRKPPPRHPQEPKHSRARADEEDAYAVDEQIGIPKVMTKSLSGVSSILNRKCSTIVRQPRRQGKGFKAAVLLQALYTPLPRKALDEIPGSPRPKIPRGIRLHPETVGSYVPPLPQGAYTKGIWVDDRDRKRQWRRL